MSNTFTAQELADFYQKVADGGEAEFRANCTNKEWFSSSGSPCLSSIRQDWRIKPTKKELKDYRNYKKAQLIQQLAEIVIRHDIETT